MRILVGGHTVDYVRSRRAERRAHPLEKLDGESRWEALDADTLAPGPHAMVDERAADQLTSETYRRALADLSRSCRAQPVGNPAGAPGSEKPRTFRDRLREALRGRRT